MIKTLEPLIGDPCVICGHVRWLVEWTLEDIEYSIIACAWCDGPDRK